MGNIYSLLDLKQDDDKTEIIQKEIIELEQNIKNIEHMLLLLNKKCDKIMTTIVEIDNRTYQLIETGKNDLIIEDASEWDYYDLHQNIDLNKVVYSPHKPKQY
jgi:hypothetical protein